MYNFIKKYLKPHIVPLNTIEISQKAIIANYRLWKKLQPSYKLISILKSNAYGHGIRPMCQILNTIQHEVDMVGVDSLPEYQIVRDQTTFPILILNETNHHNYHYFDFRRTSLVVYTLDTIKFL
jgi:alanine racemase